MATSALRRVGFAPGIAVAALALASCGGPKYAAAPAQKVDLGGHWIYVKADSDDADALIRKALPKPRRPQYSDRDPLAAGADPGSDPSGGGGQRGGGQRGGGQRSGGRGGSSGNDSTPTNQISNVVPVWGRGSPGDYVRAFVVPAPRLDVVEQPDLVTLTQGERRRSLQPGDQEPFSVTDRFGWRTVRAGWKGAVFTISSTGPTQLNIVEKFWALPNDRLGTEVEFGAMGVRSVKVRSVYRRATAAELVEPPAEGPPVPGPR